MADDTDVTAIIAAHNEADIIGPVIEDLVRQRVEVYLIDDASTDDTVRIASAYLGRGLRAIERRDAPTTEERPFAWMDILRRKQEIARSLGRGWFIHHDADEFRESPWPALDLREAIALVDAGGYNAIDFHLLNFQPTHDRFVPGTDPRQAFRYYEPAEPWNRVQIKCWKQQPHDVDLTTTGGHEVLFEGRRVFPLRFLLRHYPLRGQRQGERKVFRERKGRFLESERAKGWHVQYAAYEEGQSFIRDEMTLREFDPDAVRVDLALDCIRDLTNRCDDRDAENTILRQELADACRAIERQRVEITEARAVIASYERDVVAARTVIDAQRAEISTARDTIDAYEREISLARATIEGQQAQFEALSAVHRRHDVSRLPSLSRVLRNLFPKR